MLKKIALSDYYEMIFISTRTSMEVSDLLRTAAAKHAQFWKITESEIKTGTINQNQTSTMVDVL